MNKKILVPVILGLVLALSANAALAATTDGTITVRKDSVACANATVAIYEVESKYWGLYQKVGAYVTTLTTNASGMADFTGLDSAKTYLAKVFYAARTYEAKFTPAASVTIDLEEVSWLKGNIVPLLAGAGILFAILLLISVLSPRHVRFGWKP